MKIFAGVDALRRRGRGLAEGIVARCRACERILGSTRPVRPVAHAGADNSRASAGTVRKLDRPRPQPRTAKSPLRGLTSVKGRALAGRRLRHADLDKKLVRLGCRGERTGEKVLGPDGARAARAPQHHLSTARDRHRRHLRRRVVVAEVAAERAPVADRAVGDIGIGRSHQGRGLAHGSRFQHRPCDGRARRS